MITETEVALDLFLHWLMCPRARVPRPRALGKRGLATLCIGGGQGIAMIVESVN